MMTNETIDVNEAATLAASDPTVVLLDVRTPDEYRGESGHLQNSILIPLQELDRRASELEPHRGKTLLVYCRSGNRSGKAAAYLRQKGFKALNVEGGIIAWHKQALPVVRES
jgi:rhodanese-related sulfurtransferase